MAILLVVFSHFTIPGFEGGFVGVDVFFVISGFVITSMLIRSSSLQASGLSLPDFFARRCRRIIPVATLVLLVSLTIERAQGGRAAVATLAQPGRLILLFVFNWDSGAIARLLLEGNPINIYWSLSVEEQFYLVFPTLLVLAALVGRRWAWRTKAEVIALVVTLGSLGWAVSQGTSSIAVSYFSTFDRAWQLGAGCLLAFRAQGLLRLPRTVGAVTTWVGLSLIVYAGHASPLFAAPASWSRLLPVLGAVLVIGGGMAAPRWGAELVLGSAPAQWIGRWSYGLYLWQIPVLLVVAHWWGAARELSMAGRVGFIALATVLAALSFAYFENPIRRHPWLAKSPWLTLRLALATSLAGLVIVTLLCA